MERDCESELSKLNIEQNACIYHFGASVIHGQRSNILRLRCADIVEEMFVNLHECIDKKDKNIENELKSARTLQKHYVLCGIARIGILSDDINGEVNIA